MKWLCGLDAWGNFVALKWITENKFDHSQFFINNASTKKLICLKSSLTLIETPRVLPRNNIFTIPFTLLRYRGTAVQWSNSAKSCGRPFFQILTSTQRGFHPNLTHLLAKVVLYFNRCLGALTTKLPRRTTIIIYHLMYLCNTMYYTNFKHGHTLTFYTFTQLENVSYWT